MEQVTLRLFELIGVNESAKFQAVVEAHIRNQNQASSKCITQFIGYIKDPTKQLEDGDLSLIVETYETSLHFVL